MENCIFCKIVNNELPGIKIYDDDDVLAFMDIQPINPGHLLIIPKKHAELVSEVDDSVIAKMNVIAKKLNAALRKSGLKADGVNFFLADGAAAGQEVFHVHLHIFPRFKNDGFGLRFPENYRNKPQASELKIVAEKIKSSLKLL